MSKNNRFEDPLGKPYEIPEKFWTSFAEQTAGGYLAFWVDIRGVVNMKIGTDNQCVEEAICSVAQRKLLAITNAKGVIDTQDFLNGGQDDSGCGDASCGECYPDDN